MTRRPCASAGGNRTGSLQVSSRFWGGVEDEGLVDPLFRCPGRASEGAGELVFAVLAGTGLVDPDDPVVGGALAADMTAKLRRVIIAARFKRLRADQPQPAEIHAIRLAWEDAEDLAA